ncbi:MAG: T9SS type A sorting domain-containing protein [Ignavibacteria bacterium]|nr:T9SS type A sorting domain-containing protein [Ignavibacteria bacterium]
MKRLKNILLVFIFISITIESYSKDSIDYWLSLNSPTNQYLRCCSFIDSLRGWAGGDSGTVIHTSNGGLNWIFQPTPIPNEHINDIFFLNERLGWGLAWDITYDSNSYGTYILKTMDGGSNWDAMRYPVNDVFMNAIIFLDSLTGYMGGYPLTIMKTTDGGYNWFPCYIDTNSVVGHFPVNNFAFYSPRIAYASGGFIDIAGVIWTTTNYGQSWDAKAVGPEPVNGMFLFDSITVLGVGGDYEYGTGIVKTTNGGANWDYESLYIFGIAFSVAFRTKAEGWAPMGFAQEWIYTLDSGKTWLNIETPDSSRIYDVQFTDYRNGFAVGEDGAILKYNQEAINVPNNQNIIPTETKLYQNYPNPFNPSTVIEYSLPKSSYVILKVYDLLGRELMTLRNEVQKTGEYKINFTNSTLPSGVYFYKLYTKTLDSNNPKESVLTRKMVLIK